MRFLLFAVALIVFAVGGLRFDKTMAPLVISLALYDAAGLLALTPFVDERESVSFVVTSLSISPLAAVFLAASSPPRLCPHGDDPPRLHLRRR